MQNINRRGFISKAATAAAGVTLLANSRSVFSAQANDRINLAVVGSGSRSYGLVRPLMDREQGDVRFLYCVDANLVRAQAQARELTRPDAKTIVTQELDKALNDRNVNGVVIATPDHWHTPQSVLACMAGKDVYVEKPVAHSPWETEQLVKAVKKYNRILQVGTQTRSTPYCVSAKKFIEEGKLGDIQFCRIHNMWTDEPPAELPTGETVPASLNWDLWNGPAPKRDYSSIYIKQWQWFKEFGMGIMGLQGIHQIDMTHWILGLGYPKSAYCVGGNNLNPGGRNTPDTQSVVYDFGKMVVNVEQVQKLPYMLETDNVVRQSDMFPYWMQNSTRVEIYGLKGLMVIGRLGAGWQVFIRTKDRKPVSPFGEYGRYPNKDHLDNFIDCMRSRKEPNAPAWAAAKSTLLVHYGLISLALGSRKLDIDPQTGAILGCPEAAALWRPEYRKPYDVPEVK